MIVRQLILTLLGENPDAEIFMCADVKALDAVEACPGDPLYDLKPYVVLHSGCKYPDVHGT